MVYQFKSGARVPAGATADATVEALEDIRRRHGELTNRIIARDWVAAGDGHPLNPWFTPDSEEAALRWWEHEAGQIVRAIVVTEVVPEQQAPVRAYVVTQDNGDQHYERITAVVTEPDRRKQLVADLRRESQAFTSKLNEVLALIELMG